MLVLQCDNLGPEGTLPQPQSVELYYHTADNHDQED
jgi:hypothetical protein